LIELGYHLNFSTHIHKLLTILNFK